MLRTIFVEVPGAPYTVQIGAGLLDNADGVVSSIVGEGRVLVVADEAVASPWGMKLAQCLARAGVCASTLMVPSGESSKSAAQAQRIWDALADDRVGRDGLVIALGGGVIGDLAAFCASTWHRGISVLNMPTTLLSMVDASVGGKTAINHPTGKNLIGTFWQPRGVLADTATLSTLPRREIRSGIAEIVKAALIRDPRFFAWIETNAAALASLEGPTVDLAIERAVQIKAGIVALDEREGGERALLNAGHTIGHAVETCLGYEGLTHGEAVALGLVVEGRIAVALGTGWGPESQQRLERLLSYFGLPVAMPASEALSAGRILEATYADKKTRAGRVRYVLPRMLGEARWGIEVADDIVLKALGSVPQGPPVRRE